jgi:hypothetical protein
MKIAALTSGLLLATSLASAQAPPGASVVSRYCLVNGRYVWLDGRTSCPASSSTPSTSSTVPSGAGQIAYGIGYAFTSWLTRGSGSSTQEQRRDEEAKLAAEAQARAQDEERRRDELHQRLMGTLKLTGLTDLSMKRIDGQRDLQLKKVDRGGELALKTEEVPQGTSFFGQGGGPASRPAESLDDPKVVDLRNLQRAIVLLRSAPQQAAGDTDLILSEALNTANGDTSVVGSLPGDYSVPVISENGLLAFQ